MDSVVAWNLPIAWLDFVSPWLGVWSLAALIPLAIHLWNQRPRQKIPWAAVQFLRDAVRQRARQNHWEQWLLLLFRMLALLLLGIAVTDPIWRAANSEKSNTSESSEWIVLAIDTSYSMNYSRDDQTAWQKAGTAVRQYIQRSRANTYFCLVDLGQPSRSIIATGVQDKARVLEEFDRMQPGDGSADLLTCLNEIDRLFQTHRFREPMTKSAKAIFFTDLGKVTWQDTSESTVRERWESLQKRIEFSIVPCGNEPIDSSNYAIHKMEIENDGLVPFRASTILVEVSHFPGNHARSTLVELIHQGRTVGSQFIQLDGRQSKIVRFPWTPSDVGPVILEARLSDDSLSHDNHRWLCVHVQKKQKILVWSQYPEQGRYVHAALQSLATESNAWDITLKTSSVLGDGELDDYYLAFVCDVDIRETLTAEALKHFADRGRGLVFFLGPNIQADDYNRLFSPSLERLTENRSVVREPEPGSRSLLNPLLPLRLGTPSDVENYGVDPLDYQSKLLAGFRDFPESGLLGLPIFQYWKVDPNSYQSLQVDLALSNGHPLILRQSKIHPSVIWVLTSPSPESDPRREIPVWNALPAWPSFVPLMASMVQELNRGANSAFNLLLGDPLQGSFDKPTTRATFQIQSPDQVSSVFQWNASDSEREWRLSPSDQIGIYQVDSPEYGIHETLAVNVDTRESDPTVLELQELSFLKAVPIDLPPQVPGNVAAESRRLFRYFLVACLILLVCEMLIRWYMTNSPTMFAWNAILISLRWLGLTVLVWMISGKTTPVFEREKAELFVVLDRSGSMSVTDPHSNTAESPTRTDSRFVLAAEASSLANPSHPDPKLDRFKMRFFTIGDRLEEHASMHANPWKSDVQADHLQSRLGDTLNEAILSTRGNLVAGIVLFTDGIVTEGRPLSDAARTALEHRIPVYTVQVGEPIKTPDIWLQNIVTDQTVFQGDRVQVLVQLHRRDIDENDHLITLRHEVNKKVIGQTSVHFDDKSLQAEASLEYVAQEPGEMSLQVEVAAVQGEANTVNNQSRIQVDVRDSAIPILFVQKYPSYEFRFLKHLLERTRQAANPDRAAFDLTCVLEEGDPRYAEQDVSATRVMPVGLEALQRFDCVILGDVSSNLLGRSAEQSLRDYVVQHGGGLMTIAGPTHMPRDFFDSALSMLIPVEPQIVSSSTPPSPFRWRLTEIGLNSLPLKLESNVAINRRLFEQLPVQCWRYQGIRAKAIAQVLANSHDKNERVEPLLVTAFVGAGRVAFQATDESYQWQSYLGDDIYYQRYWTQMIRWLSRNQAIQNSENLVLAVDRPQYLPDESIEVELRMEGKSLRQHSDASVEVLLEGEGGQATAFPLQRNESDSTRFTAKIPPQSQGNYRLRLSTEWSYQKETSFVVRAAPSEMTVLSPDTEQLQTLAAISRGQFVPLNDVHDLWDCIPEPTSGNPRIQYEYALWNHPFVIGLFVALLSLEWLLRRRMDLA